MFPTSNATGAPSDWFTNPDSSQMAFVQRLTVTSKTTKDNAAVAKARCTVMFLERFKFKLGVMLILSQYSLFIIMGDLNGDSTANIRYRLKTAFIYYNQNFTMLFFVEK